MHSAGLACIATACASAADSPTLTCPAFKSDDLVVLANSCCCPVQVMFAKPLPALSRQLNAWVTALTCQWLMGPCQVNDVELADGKQLKSQGVKVERWGHAWKAHVACPVPCRCVHLMA